MARIVLVVDGSVPSERFVQGVHRYSRRHQLEWTMHLQVRLALTAQPLSADGLILANHQILEPEVAQAHSGLAVVSLSKPVPGHQRCAVIDVDQAAAGRLGARHFHETGLHQVATIGGWHVSTRRLVHQAFQAEAESLGMGVRHCEPPPDRDAAVYDTLIQRTLGVGPHPIGVMCHQDQDAVWLVDACQRLGLAVPEQVQVLGVGDSAFTCLRATPPLSSIAWPWYDLGQSAALSLHRLLCGAPGSDLRIVVPPLRVMVRQSTVSQGMTDPLVRRVKTLFARQSGLSVPAAAVALGVSQATLQRHCQAATGMSVHQYRHRLRLVRARDMIQTDSRSLAAIARSCGYANYARFHVHFVRCFGQSPSSYREAGR